MEQQLSNDQQEPLQALTFSTSSTDVPPALPVAATAQAEHVAGRDADGQRVHDLLAALKHQSSKHRWMGTAAIVLGSLLAFNVVMCCAVTAVMSAMTGHAAKFSIDLSLNSFGMSGHITNGVSQVSVSGVLPLVLLSGSGFFAAVARRERLKLTRSLAQYDDVRGVGPLVEALFLRSPLARREAASALKRLMPRLRPGDTGLLNRSQRLQLLRFLGQSMASLHPQDADLSLAILAAYRAIGDGSELSTVKRIAYGRGGGESEARVRAAAQEYVELVERREEEQVQAHTLLRGADCPRDGGATLMRAASGETGAADPHALLRAAEEG